MVVYHFYHEHYFNAPIEKVWAILDDAESWPKWSKGFKKIMEKNHDKVMDDTFENMVNILNIR